MNGSKSHINHLEKSNIATFEVVYVIFTILEEHRWKSLRYKKKYWKLQYCGHDANVNQPNTIAWKFVWDITTLAYDIEVMFTI